MARRTLVVGLDDALPPPMQMGGPETGDFHGFEVDLLTEIAKRLNAQLKWRRSAWSQIVRDLDNGTIDLICSAATISNERTKTADFTRPYLQVSLAAVSRAGRGPAATKDDGRIGVRRATTASEYLERKGREPSLVSESNDELYDALVNRHVDVIVDDSPIAAHFVRTKPGLTMAALAKTGAAYGMMLRKGNPLTRELDAVIDDLDASETLRELQERWEVAPVLRSSA
jgi:polar amino acid transport system substrate-binding protein